MNADNVLLNIILEVMFHSKFNVINDKLKDLCDIVLKL